MRKESELLSWIKAQERAGQVESTGQFTIEESTAWQKLADFSLPFEGAWVVKLIQSACAAKSNLIVQQAREESLFIWRGGPVWTHEQVLDAVFNLESLSDRALAHFGVALRALAGASGLPFSLHYPDGHHAIWTGQRFEYGPNNFPIRHNSIRLTVSHLRPGESRGMFGGAGVSASARGATIAAVLNAHAQWAPVHVTLDQRLISNIFHDPTFGVSELRQPVCLLHVPPQPPQPSLKVTAKFTNPDVSSDVPVVNPEGQTFRKALKDLAEPCLAVGMVSSFVEKKRVGKGYNVTPGLQRSQLAWVADGAEVAREDLPFPKGSVALLVACSADGLETDLSTLTPRDGREKDQRREAVLRAVGANFPDAEDDKADYSTTSPTDIVGVAIMAIGAVGALIIPPAGILILGVGGLSLTLSRSRSEVLQTSLDKDFKALARDARAKAGAKK